MREKYRVKVIDRDADRTVYDEFVDSAVICTCNGDDIDRKIFVSDFRVDKIMHSAVVECVETLMEVICAWVDSDSIMKEFVNEDEIVTSAVFGAVAEAFELYEKRTGNKLDVLEDEKIEKE